MFNSNFDQACLFGKQLQQFRHGAVIYWAPM